MTKLYYWYKTGLKHYLEVTFGEDDRTVLSWCCWTSLEAAGC